MTHITLNDIYVDGVKYSEDNRKIIYLTPGHPLKFDSNTWIYKKMPTISQWTEDLKEQQGYHLNQGSNHLSFYFPENEVLSKQWLDIIRQQGFELGILELYAIEANELRQLPQNNQVIIQQVTEQNIDDYVYIHNYFALPFGEQYAKESAKQIKECFLSDGKNRLIAYLGKKPVGIVDLIITSHTVEIDGLGVMEQYRHNAIGSSIQSHVGKLAKTNPVILVADGEDTAKDMYIKQGYTYLGFRYQILKENI